MPLPTHESIPVAGRSILNSPQKYLSWIIIASGIFFRLYHFFDNRSLWGDEVMIAVNILSRDFGQLASPPLDYQQYAPLGFLWAERLLVLLFGENEMILRLFPLLCGIAALFLFNRLATYVLPPAGRLVALSCLAFAHPLVYYSVEVKQYQTELLCSILLFLSYFHFQDKTDRASVLSWGMIGALILWFSFSAIFILVGIAAVLSLESLYKRRWPLFYRQLPAFAAWAGSFLIVYVTFITVGTKSDYLKSYWADFFLPILPASRQDAVWFVKTFYHALDSPLGLNWRFFNTTHPVVVFSLAGTGLLGLGAIAFYQSNRRLFWVFGCTLLLMLLASGLQKYPIFERFQLFYVPVCFLLIGKGTAVLYSRTKNASVVAGVLGVFVAGVFLNILYQTVHTDHFGGSKRRETRQALLYVQQHLRPGDVVYLHWQLLKPLKYYAPVYAIRFPRVEGQYLSQMWPDSPAYRKAVAGEAEKMRGQGRIWLLLSNIPRVPAAPDAQDTPRADTQGFVRESDVIKEAALSKNGNLLHEYHTLDTDIYLFSNSDSIRAPAPVNPGM